MADEIVEYMVSRWTAADITAAYDRVFAAHLAGLEDTVTITSSSFEGGSANGEMSVAPGNRERFLAQCRTALARLRGEATTSTPGILIRYGNRPIRT